jgi:hypothetical protein
MFHLSLFLLALGEGSRRRRIRAILRFPYLNQPAGRTLLQLIESKRGLLLQTFGETFNFSFYFLLLTSYFLLISFVSFVAFLF